MSLVAYEASSDEESDYEDEEATKAIIIKKSCTQAQFIKDPNKDAVKDHISDDEDDFIPSVEGIVSNSISNISKLLPKPKNDTSLVEVLGNFEKPIFSALPKPKSVTNEVNIEEDDEFLHKKPKPEFIEKPNKNNEIKKMPVKITIPSLDNFKDLDKEMADKARKKLIVGQAKSQGLSGLLSILPKAKSEQNFIKVNSTPDEDKKVEKYTKPAFIPDTVKHRRPATNTEDIDRLSTAKRKEVKKLSNPKTTEMRDSDESDGDDVPANTSGDFFSFNADQSLPEVSANEINALVAKKAAKIVETTMNYLKATETQSLNELKEIQTDEKELEKSKHVCQEQLLNAEALQALVGSSTKRRRQHKEDVRLIDINSEQVLPNKDEWMRTVLASSTTYQPTGVLVDEEPASGTRRKHQITYLAHKAKANEAELQAMWAANRQNRRATQSKYGF